MKRSSNTPPGFAVSGQHDKVQGAHSFPAPVEEDLMYSCSLNVYDGNDTKINISIETDSMYTLADLLRPVAQCIGDLAEAQEIDAKLAAS